MREIYLSDDAGLSRRQTDGAMDELMTQYAGVRRVLIVPPDYTRCFSYAGELTQRLYRGFAAMGAEVDVMPAVGTHMPMSDWELRAFFGDVVPRERILAHRWQSDATLLGSVPPAVVAEISGGLYSHPIEVELNHHLLTGGYQLILSVGQVVPHEVAGMANYSKNLFVGLGGRGMINKTHLLAALCGIEQAMGEADSPARQVYDYAQRRFVDGRLPVVYVQTVTTRTAGQLKLNGLYVGASRKPYELAARQSQRLNIVHMERPAPKIVAYLDPNEMKTTWVGNKGVYRTRMAIRTGGELVLLAPGVCAFGENEEMDVMTRRVGYRGRDAILKLLRAGAFDGKLMSAAHLIHGSSEGRFRITYATKPQNLSRAEVEGVGYRWADCDEQMRRYDPATLADGWNTTEDGEEFYYISTPAIGLWKYDG